MRGGRHIGVRAHRQPRPPRRSRAHQRSLALTDASDPRHRLQWQCYVPTLALLVTEDFGLDIVNVGYLYLFFVGTSICSSFALNVHLQQLKMTPYMLLMLGYFLRCLSGLLHAFGCLAQNGGYTSFSFPLLCASRMAHGYTILLFPLTVVWIGARESNEQRPLALAQRNAYSTVGIFAGVLSGSTLASIAPSSLIAGMAPGWLNMLVSLIMLLWLRAAFVDREPCAPHRTSRATLGVEHPSDAQPRAPAGRC